MIDQGLGSPPRPGAGTWALRTLIPFVVLFGLCAAWSLASPVPSGPDESAHLIKAGAIVEGELVGKPVRNVPADVFVQVPEVVASVSKPARCDYTVARPAGCLYHLVAGSRPVRHLTYVGRYPPLYYAAVGLPLLVSGATWTLSAARVIGGLLVALFVGLAVGAAWTWGRSRLLVVAVGSAVTPAVVYLGAVVNPSGLEVAAALCLWTGLGLLVYEHADAPPRLLVAVTALAAVVLGATRPISTLFLALIVLAVVAVRPGRTRRLLRATSVRISAAIGLLAAIASALYVVHERSFEIETFMSRRGRLGLWSGARLIVAGTVVQARQAIDGFGSPNFTAPMLVEWAWAAVTVGLIATAVIATADRRRLLGVIAVLGFAVPFAITESHVQSNGAIWQGRYSLPLIVGFPVLAALALADGPAGLARRVQRLAPGAVSALGCALLVAFVWVLRRYTVGLAHGGLGLGAFSHPVGAWTPVVPAPLLAAAALVLTASWVVVIGVAGAPAREPLMASLPAEHGAPAEDGAPVP